MYVASCNNNILRCCSCTEADAHRLLPYHEMNIIISAQYTYPSSTSNNRVYCRVELMLNGSAAE